MVEKKHGGISPLKRERTKEFTPYVLAVHGQMVPHIFQPSSIFFTGGYAIGTRHIVFNTHITYLPCVLCVHIAMVLGREVVRNPVLVGPRR